MATFYLKYRPQKIAELDLVAVREQLTAILKSRSVPHAFLFAGPRGSGKTSAARIVAKVVNCEQNEKRKTKNEKREPCNRCNQCISITKGSNLDVIEIDAASNRGVDDARALRETIKLVPNAADKKVYIIDEAHMLTLEAANALLKTLEEPPEHVMFILATTQPEKLPETIRSRCTLISFKKASKGEVENSLKKAVKGEKLKIDREALDKIAQNVDGSFREAHKILEQAAAAAGRKKITKEVIEEATGGIVKVSNFLELLDKKDAVGALAEIDRVAKSGVSLRVYASEVVDSLRKLLLSRFGVENESFEEFNLYDNQDIMALIDLFSEAVASLPRAVIAQLPLELAVIKWCSKNGKWKMENGKSEKKEKTDKLTTDKPHPDNPARNATPARNAVSTAGWHSVAGGRQLKTDERSLSPVQWQQVMAKVKEKNHSIEALLRATRPQSFDGKTLTIEVFYQFHKERLENESCRNVVEEVASDILGAKPVRMVCLLSTQKKRAQDIANITEEVEEDITQAAEKIFGGEGRGEYQN